MLVICPYCRAESFLVSGKEIYPRRKDLYKKSFYQCKPCDAYVGCHTGTDKPLGRLANRELRKAKIEAHASIDPIWKSGQLHRSKVYKILAKLLEIPPTSCHIGMFDVDMCKKVVSVSVHITENGEGECKKQF